MVNKLLLFGLTLAIYSNVSEKTIEKYYGPIPVQEIIIPQTKPVSTDDIIIDEYRSIKPRFPIHLIYIRRMVRAESGYDSLVTGAGGERGLMQIGKDVWQDINPGISYDRAYERVLNVRTGIIHLDDLVRQLKLEHPTWKDLKVNNMLRLTSAAYNTGYTNLKDNGFDITQMPKSTREYIQKVVK